MSANTRLDTLSDLTAHKANLLLSCRCGRTHIYDAKRFYRYAFLRRWNTQLEALQMMTRCRSCGRRVRLSATPEAPTPDDPFPLSERDWARLQRRLRG